MEFGKRLEDYVRAPALTARDYDVLVWSARIRPDIFARLPGYALMRSCGPQLGCIILAALADEVSTRRTGLSTAAFYVKLPFISAAGRLMQLVCCYRHANLRMHHRPPWRVQPDGHLRSSRITVVSTATVASAMWRDTHIFFRTKLLPLVIRDINTTTWRLAK